MRVMHALHKIALAGVSVSAVVSPVAVGASYVRLRLEPPWRASNSCTWHVIPPLSILGMSGTPVSVDYLFGGSSRIMRQ
jgi:hypothetical protein